jgi:hypothetical protein
MHMTFTACSAACYVLFAINASTVMLVLAVCAIYRKEITQACRLAHGVFAAYTDGKSPQRNHHLTAAKQQGGTGEAGESLPPNAMSALSTDPQSLPFFGAAEDHPTRKTRSNKRGKVSFKPKGA